MALLRCNLNLDSKEETSEREGSLREPRRRAGQVLSPQLTENAGTGLEVDDWQRTMAARGSTRVRGIARGVVRHSDWLASPPQTSCTRPEAVMLVSITPTLAAAGVQSGRPSERAHARNVHRTQCPSDKEALQSTLSISWSIISKRNLSPTLVAS